MLYSREARRRVRGAGTMESIVIKIVAIALMLGVLALIALGDRRIRKEREAEDRERREREVAGGSE